MRDASEIDHLFVGVMLSVPLQLPDADIVFYPSLLDEQESNHLLSELTDSVFQLDRLT
jgi:hypothetical protein